MIIKRDREFGSQIVNYSLLGGISAGDEEQRIRELLDNFRPGGSLTAERGDVYRPGETVSMEVESDHQLAVQEGLDCEIVQENWGITPTKKGLPPCKRVGLED